MKVNFTKKSLLNLISFFPTFSFFLAFLIFPFSSTFAQECDAGVASFGYNDRYELEFVGVEYDFPEEGQSTWFYTMTAKCGYSIRGISIPLNNDCVKVTDAGTWGDDSSELCSGSGYPRVRNSCWWGYRLNFRKRLRAPGSRNYYFTIDKNLEIEPVSQVYAKAGCYYYQMTVCGPSSECNEKVEDTPPPPPAESCIAGVAFHDQNVNGVRDTDEPLIEGVTVKLRTSTGSIVDQAATDVDGAYSFCGLDPDSYIIQMEASFEYLLTQSNIGDDDFDNDLEGSATITGIMTINEVGESFTNVDGGYFKFVDYDNQNLTVNNTPTVNAIGGNSTPSTVDESSNPVNNSFMTHEIFEDFEDDMDESMIDMDVEVKVFPNPVVNRATFKVANTDDGDVRIEVRTQSNQLVQTTRIAQYETEQSLDFSNFAKGAYFIYFITDNGVKVEKIVKK